MDFRRRPHWGIVDSMSRPQTVRAVHESLPNGLPRLTHRRNAASSASVARELM